MSGATINCTSGAPPRPLLYKGSRAAVMPGFLVPGFDPLNASTYPVQCQPDTECAFARSMGGSCKTPQHPFEPVLCPSGRFCTGGNASAVCPAGSFCMPGATAPTPCPAFSLCPEGSERPRYIGSVVLLLALLALLAAAAFYYTRLRPKPAPEAYPSHSMRKDEKRRVLQRGVKRARIETGLEHALRIDFENLCVSLRVGDSGSDDDVQGDDKSKSKNKKNDDAVATATATSTSPDAVAASPSTAATTTTAPRRPRRGRVPILEGVSGSIAAGNVTAIMSPSGGGKTTAVKALLGQLPRDKFAVSGRIAFNGRDGGLSDSGSAALRSAISVVPQDDVLHDELTIEQNVAYAAELGLPANWSSEDRAEFADVVVSLLGLAKHRHTLAGSASGGQRKRTAIACSLATAPACIVLDEPTSPLDAYSALELLRILKQVALAGRLTLFAVIHQPREELFAALDQLLLLAPTARGGRAVYEGPARDCLKALAPWVVVRDGENPADAIMDAIVAHGEEMADAWQRRIEEERRQKDQQQQQRSNNNSGRGGGDDNGSDDDAGAGASAAASAASAPATAVHAASVVDTRHAPFLRQCLLFHNRAIAKSLAQWRFMLLEFGILVLLALILGQGLSQFTPRATYKDDYAVLSPLFIKTFLPQLLAYSVMSASLAGAVSGVRLFGEEKERFRREAAGGLSMTAYFIGVSAASMYRIFAASVMFGGMIHFIGAHVVDFGAVMLPNMFLSYWCISVIGQLISLVTTLEYASVSAGLVSVVLGMMSGFVSGFPVWMRRLSFCFWHASLVYKDMYDRINAYADPPFDAWGYDPDTTPGLALGVQLAMIAVLSIATWALIMWRTQSSF